jgi:2-haloalkanoic acid dehalogenase type II
MPPIKAVLFDLDDTLWPIVPVIKRAEDVLYDWLRIHVPAVAQRVSIESMRERRQELMAIDPVYQIDLHGLRHAVLTEAFTNSGEDVSLVDKAMEVFSRARNDVAPFSDVLPTLNSLRNRVALGTVTNGMADLRSIGLSHFFHTSIAAYHFGSAKPDPAIFLAACEALKVAPHEAVYVGDDPLLDVEAAKNAGLHSVWMNRLELDAGRLLPAHVQPDAICTTLHEMRHWLEDRIAKPGTAQI